MGHDRLGIIVYLLVAWAVAVVLIIVAFAVASWFTRKRTKSLWD